MCFLLILPKPNVFWKSLLERNHSFVFSHPFWMGKSQKCGKVFASHNSSNMIQDYILIIRIKQTSKCFTKYFAHSVVFFFLIEKLRHSQENRFEWESFTVVSRVQGSQFLFSSQKTVTTGSIILLEASTLPLQLYLRRESRNRALVLRWHLCAPSHMASKAQPQADSVCPFSCTLPGLAGTFAQLNNLKQMIGYIYFQIVSTSLSRQSPFLWWGMV